MSNKSHLWIEKEGGRGRGEGEEGRGERKKGEISLALCTLLSRDRNRRMILPPPPPPINFIAIKFGACVACRLRSTKSRVAASDECEEKEEEGRALRISIARAKNARRAQGRLDTYPPSPLSLPILPSPPTALRLPVRKDALVKKIRRPRYVN